MTDQEDPEFPSSLGHINTTAVYRTVATENDSKTRRKDFVQQRKFSKGHINIGERDRNAV